MEIIFSLTLTPNDVVIKKHYHGFSEASYKRLVSLLSKRARKEHCLIYAPDESYPGTGISSVWKEIRLFYPKRDADGNLYFEIVLHICYILQKD